MHVGTQLNQQEALRYSIHTMARAALLFAALLLSCSHLFHLYRYTCAVTSLYRPNDGPTKCLRDFMQSQELITPLGWNGVRQLDRK
jgi:hypothetical protein